MKIRKVMRIWLPPEGDHRLLHFQQDLGRRRDDPSFFALFPFLTGEIGEEFPVRAPAVGLGRWWCGPGGLFLETSVPGWKFQIAGPLSRSLKSLELPPPPAWVWTRGRLGNLEVDHDETWSQVAWKLSGLVPWRPKVTL